MTSIYSQRKIFCKILSESSIEQISLEGVLSSMGKMWAINSIQSPDSIKFIKAYFVLVIMETQTCQTVFLNSVSPCSTLGDIQDHR